MNITSVSIVDNTDLVKKATDEAIERALEAVGLQAEGYAKELCPVDTGRLRNSITHQQIEKNTEAIGTNVEYAPYVEMGTQRMKAQPFIKPAAEDHVSEYKSIFETYLKG
jgi:HK97 gp10 family phage protein